MEKWDARLWLLVLLLIGSGVVTANGQPPLGERQPFGKPGSILFWPYVNTDGDEGGAATLLSLTNTNGGHMYCGGGVPGIFDGTVRVRLYFVYEPEPEIIPFRGGCTPGNGDECDMPLIAVTGPNAGTTTDNTGTTGNDTSCGGTGDTIDEWWCWTASCSGTATVSTCELDSGGSANFDTTLAAFNSCTGIEIACNDDVAGCTFHSTIAFPVTAGTEYLIRVSGFDGDTGDYVMDISCTGIFCPTADRTLTLSPYDHISIFADDLFPQAENQIGYVIGIAYSALDIGGVPGGEAINFNSLIGSAQAFDPGTNYVWSYNALTFRSLVTWGPEDTCGHFLANVNDPVHYNFNGAEYDYVPICNLIPSTWDEDATTSPEFQNLLSVANVDHDINEESVRFFTFNRVERRFSDNELMACFKQGDMVVDPPLGWGLAYMTMIEELGAIPDPCPATPYCIPDEKDFAGWTMFAFRPNLQANCNPGLLSVFKQSKGDNQFYHAGSNNFGGNLYVEEQVRFNACFTPPPIQ